MSFITDKQTLADLNILGRYVNNSIFSVFNAVVTPGGEKLLDKFFHEPLDNVEKINKRSQLFRFFQEGKYRFSIDYKVFLAAERYLSHADFSNPVTAWFNMLRIYSLSRIGLDREYKMIGVGLEATVNILKQLKDFVKSVEKSKDSNLYADTCKLVNSILSSKQLKGMHDVASKNKHSLFLLAKYDHIFRYSLKDEMRKILDIIYDIDVNIAVAKVAEERGFCYAEADDKKENYLFFENVFHPCVNGAVANNIKFYKDRNVVFLTGANMAGKSTLMKAIGVACYLAHMGFPVPASKMKFSVKEGMFTSINVPDDLHMGYSHFYAEVLRVKTVAQAVSSKSHLLIIFDELFKGTNVKDAYDATVAITKAFSEKNNSAFIISTHIMEAGETLKEKSDNMQFLFLPTVMKGGVPIYPYKLQEGITNDRHGMIIINNEKILEIINGGVLKTS